MRSCASSTVPGAPLPSTTLARQIFSGAASSSVNAPGAGRNARMALRVAHRGYVIQTGRIALQDTGANLLKSDLVRKTYLGEK